MTDRPTLKNTLDSPRWSANPRIWAWSGWLVALVLAAWIVLDPRGSGDQAGREHDSEVPARHPRRSEPLASGGALEAGRRVENRSVSAVSSAPRNELDLPPDPVEGIARLRAKFSGNKLGDNLYRAGSYYAALGLEEAKEFILNVPPGSAGDQGVSGAAANAAHEDRPALFAFFQENEGSFGKRTVDIGCRHLLTVWANHDFDGGWSFLLGQDLPEEQKVDWAVSMLSQVDERVLEALESVAEPDLRQRLTASWPSVQAHLAAGDYSIFGKLEGHLEDRSLQRSVRVSIDKSDHPARAITALYEAGVTGSRPVVVLALEELIGRDATSGIEVLTSLGDPGLTSDVIFGAYRSIARYDLAAARAWAGEIQEPRKREAALNDLDRLARERGEAQE